MNDFWKATALILVATVLGLSIGKTEKDISAVLSMAACSIAACAAISLLEPVLDYLWEIQALCGVPEEIVGILVKAVGIALSAELSAAVCADVGNASLGKMIQLLGGATVLSLSLPLFQTLMTIIKEMIGGL